jgi:hypothetical protein
MNLGRGIELRDDISRKDIGYFFLLLVGLTVWTWVVFYSGLILK